MTDRRAYTRHTPAERIVSTTERLDFLKEKLVTQEIRCQILEGRIEKLRERILAEENRLRRLVPVSEKASV